MSELIDNSAYRKTRLKELILKLHKGINPDEVKEELKSNLEKIPYGEVVEVEQQLIEEGLPETEVLKLCDMHSEVLNGHVDLTAMKIVPPGHPVDVIRQENKLLIEITGKIRTIIKSIPSRKFDSEMIFELTGLFNSLLDVDKHYKRKEYLIFPYLEKLGITGPPKVMWGKHDEIREFLKGSLEILNSFNSIDKEEFMATSELVFIPAIKGVEDMVGKEEEILLPMCLDNLTEENWVDIHEQTMDIGYCLYDPPFEWDYKIDYKEENDGIAKNEIRLPTGSFHLEELLTIFNTLPVDITFVDKDDKVKYYSQSKERIFQRTRAIINRDVRHCHPPASTHIVDKILTDFKMGKQNRAPFWINMGGRFIHIEYFALRDENDNYIGTLEVSQDLTHLRSLSGEQRILSYQ